MLVGVLLPLWVSVLARSFAWVTLLRREGVVNAVLLGAGLIQAPLPLIWNEFGVSLGMISTSTMLPYAILPMASHMRGLDPALLAAARGLGASRAQVFARVFLPLSLPGVVGAGVLVLIFLARVLRDAGAAGRRPGADGGRIHQPANPGAAAVGHRHHAGDHAGGGDRAAAVPAVARGRPAGAERRAVTAGPTRPVRGAAWTVLLFLLLPMAVVLPVSLTDQRYLSLPRHGLSLQYYANLLQSAAWQSSIGQSLLIACCAAAIAVVLGTLCAIGCWRLGNRVGARGAGADAGPDRGADHRVCVGAATACMPGWACWTRCWASCSPTR